MNNLFHFQIVWVSSAWAQACSGGSWSSSGEFPKGLLWPKQSWSTSRKNNYTDEVFWNGCQWRFRRAFVLCTNAQILHLEKVSLGWWVTCGHLWAMSTCVFVLFVHRSMHADEKCSRYPSRLNICLPSLHQYLDQRKMDILFLEWTVLSSSSASGSVYNTQPWLYFCTQIPRSDLRRDHVSSYNIPQLRILDPIQPNDSRTNIRTPREMKWK